MFCSVCGAENVVTNANYCSCCGAKVEKAPSSQISELPSYDDFKGKKEFDRSTKFRTRSKGVKKTKLEAMQDVSIQVGIMTSKAGDLRIKRGSNLSIKVSPSTTSEELLQKAIEKYSRFNAADIRNLPHGYKLLYPDKDLVERMPGKDEPFMLNKYKEELGKAYSPITFYLAINSDYFDFVSCGMFDDSNSDSKSDDEIVDKSVACTITKTIVPLTGETSKESTVESPKIQCTLDTFNIKPSCSASIQYLFRLWPHNKSNSLRLLQHFQPHKQNKTYLRPLYVLSEMIATKTWYQA